MSFQSWVDIEISSNMQTKWLFTIMSLSEVEIETLSGIIDLQKERNKFYSNIYNVIPI